MQKDPEFDTYKKPCGVKLVQNLWLVVHHFRGASKVQTVINSAAVRKQAVLQKYLQRAEIDG